MKIANFFHWLAAADRGILGRCPPVESIKYGAIGAAVLIPMVSGFCAMWFYAGKLLGSVPGALAAAVVWSLVIMSIDRLMLASYRPFATWGKWLTQIVLRMVLVLLTAMTIAHPICLEQYRGAISETYQASIKKKTEAAQTSQKARTDRIAADYARDTKPLEDAVAEQKKESSDEEYTATLLTQASKLDSSVSPTLTAAHAESSALAQQLDKEKADLKTCEDSLKHVRACIYSERKDGFNDCTDGGKTPKKPGRYFSPAQQKDRAVCPRLAELLATEGDLDAERTAHNQKIKDLTGLSEAVQTRVRGEEAKAQITGAETKNRVNDEVKKKVQDRRKALDDKLADADARIKLLKDANSRATKQAELDATSENERLQERQKKGPQDPMQETLALWHVITTGGDEDAAAAGNWRWVAGFFSFALIFGTLVMVDSFPVVMKFLCTGPYDREVHAIDEAARLRFEAIEDSQREHIYRRVRDTLAMETRAHLEETHRLERERHKTEGRGASPDFD